MSAANLCAELSRRGVTLSLVPHSGRLSLEGDAAALDARVLAEVRAMKPQLIAMLREREYSQPVPDEKAAALAALAREVEKARRGVWCNPTREVLDAWENAEKVCGCALTLSGTPRRKFSNEEYAGALYDPALATAEAHRAFDAGEVTAAQRDTLLRFAKPP